MKENHIHIEPHIHITSVRPIEYTIRNLIEFRGYDKIMLDFSRCKTVFAETMMPIVCVCLKYRLEHVEFELVPPVQERLKRLFINCGWANLIAPRQFRERGISVHENIPVIAFRDQNEQNAVVNSSLDNVLKMMSYLDRGNLRALEWSVNEICDNVLNHSDSAIGGLFQMNVRRNQREVEFIVADAGRGIPDSLRSISNQHWTDEFALEQSIRQGVTRDPAFGQGNGLFGTYQMAALSKGTFHINSGRAHLVHDRGGICQIRPDEFPFIGTQVVCAINFQHPALLEQALAFRGDDYKMTDYIDLKYEIDENTINFLLKNETESLGSRRAGYSVRQKIKNLLGMDQRSKILCDLVDVTVMSSSFADEVFGKLARDLGINNFDKRIIFLNISKTNNLLIRQAITQRLASAIDAASTPPLSEDISLV